MQTDNQLRARLAEIRTMRQNGEINSHEAAHLREAASAARKAARAENEAGPIRRTRAPILPAPVGQVWTPPTLARGFTGPDPQAERLKLLFRRSVTLLRDILRMPRNDDGSLRKQVLPTAEKDAPKQAKPRKRKAKEHKGGGHLDPHTAIMYAYRPDRDDASKIRASKREVFTLETSDNPGAAAFARAFDLQGSGWVTCVLDVGVVPDNMADLPERLAMARAMNERDIAADLLKRIHAKSGTGNVPKTGWHPKHQYMAKPNGHLLSPKERQAFALVFRDAGEPASKDTVKEVQAIAELTAHCRVLREKFDMAIDNVDLPLPEPEDQIVYTIELDGWMRMGDREVDSIPQKARPLADVKDAEGKTIPGSGAKLMAERLALNTTIGPNGCFCAKRVVYTCPESGQTKSVTRNECLRAMSEEEEETLNTAFEGDVMPLDEFLSLDVSSRIKVARGELAPSQPRFATHWTRNTNTNGPWQKCKDSFKGGTWDRRARAQGL